jgi:hypothetical protein
MDTRHLDLEATGKSKEVIEVADLVMMGRLLYEDEYDSQKLKVYDYVEDEGGGGYHRKEVLLDSLKTYMILFIPKNRNGSTTQQVVFEVDYDTNSWTEIGYAMIRKNANG